MSILRIQGALEGKGHYNKKGKGRMRRMYSQFEFYLGKHVSSVYRSLLPELKDAPSQRTEVNLELRNDMVKLQINSDDIVSFRAALNTWLRLIKIAYDMARYNLEFGDKCPDTHRSSPYF